jgi:hypothetical protein
MAMKLITLFVLRRGAVRAFFLSNESEKQHATRRFAQYQDAPSPNRIDVTALRAIDYEARCIAALHLWINA